MKRKIALFCIIALVLLMVAVIAGCSEEGCSGGCDSNEDCECVPDSTAVAEGQQQTYHYSCTGGNDCGCGSCDSDEGKDGEPCNPA